MYYTLSAEEFDNRSQSIELRLLAFGVAAPMDYRFIPMKSLQKQGYAHPDEQFLVRSFTFSSKGSYLPRNNTLITRLLTYASANC